jgi:hypothetical protein
MYPRMACSCSCPHGYYVRTLLLNYSYGQCGRSVLVHCLRHGRGDDNPFGRYAVGYGHGRRIRPTPRGSVATYIYRQNPQGS